MGYGIKLKVFGDYACFTRPEMKVERVSYDVMTPSAARGIVEAIYWKPAIRWEIDRIHVLNDIKFTNIRRNEVKHKIPSRNVKLAMQDKDVNLWQVASEIRQQRASLVLKDVCYIIEAHFEMTDKAGENDSREKHYNIALRRIKQGQCHHQPYLGTREFSAGFEWVDEIKENEVFKGDKDLGWMLWDIDYENRMNPVFFKAIMKNGVLDITNPLKAR